MSFASVRFVWVFIHPTRATFFFPSPFLTPSPFFLFPVAARRSRKRPADRLAARACIAELLSDDTRIIQILSCLWRAHSSSARRDSIAMASCVLSQAGFAPPMGSWRRNISATRRRHSAVVARRRRRGLDIARAFEDQDVEASGDAGHDAEEAPGSGDDDEASAYVENDEELAERQAVGELVGWCVSRGAAGSGLSVLLPDGRGRGRGLEASRDIAVRRRQTAPPFQNISSPTFIIPFFLFEGFSSGFWYRFLSFSFSPASLTVGSSNAAERKHHRKERPC